MSVHSTIDIENSTPIGNAMLSEELGKHFSAACGTGEFAEDIHSKWLRQKSGYKPGEDPFSSFHEVEKDGNEITEKKRRDRFMSMAKAMNNVDIFHHNGHGLNYEQMMDGLDGLIDKKKDDLEDAKANLKVEDHEVATVNGRKFEGTEEQFEHFVQLGVNNTEGSITEDMMVEENGVMVKKAVLAEVENIEAELKDAEEYQTELAVLVNCHGADSEEVKTFIAETDPALKDEIVIAHAAVDQGLETDPDVAEKTPDDEPVVEGKTPAQPNQQTVTLKADTLDF